MVHVGVSILHLIYQLVSQGVLVHYWSRSLNCFLGEEVKMGTKAEEKQGMEKRRNKDTEYTVNGHN